MAKPSTIGRYEVDRLLGEGGMGAVYLARDPTIGRHLAIKVLRTDDEEYRRRFQLEVSAAGALRHRHIITIFDSGEHEGSPFLAMEYVPGETLAQIIARRAPLAPSEKLRLVIELCDGLAHAHRAGIVHRDVKPANVLVDDDDQSVKVLDFGIARLAAGVGTTMTKSGMLVGTLTYMAPEQILGKRVDQRSDIFAVGCVLYELLSYERAFPGGLDDGLMYRIVHEAPPPLAQVVPGIDPEVVAVVDRALRKDPAERYGDIKEMSAALAIVRQRLITQAAQTTIKQPVPVPAVAPPMTSDARRASWRTAAIAASVMFLVAAAAGTWYVLSTRAPSPAVTAVAEAPASPLAPAGTGPATDARAQEKPPASVPAPPIAPPLVAPETRLRLEAPAPFIATLDGAPFTGNALVSPGSHTLIARRPGVIGVRRDTIEIGDGQTRTVSADLSVGYLVAGVLPFPFTSVSVEGQAIATRTLALTGPLVAEFVPAAGSALSRRSATFTLASGAERDLSTLLRTGGVRFVITPAAEVTIDTRAFGTVTQGELLGAAEGEYPIRIARRGYPDFTERLRVPGGLNVTVSYAYNFATGSWVRVQRQ